MTPINRAAMDHPASINRKARNLILDGALGAAIAVLLPIPHIGWLKAIVLVVLNVVLVRGIVRLWRPQRGGDALAKVGLLFGFASALVLSLVAWLAMVGVGVLAPMVGALAPGVAMFTYVWVVGQTVNHYYLSSVASSEPPRSAGGPDEI
jgi:hypothetical protein